MAEGGFGDFSEESIEVLGAESSYGANGRAEAAREVILKIGVRHPSKEALQIFAREIYPAATAMAQGLTGFAGGRPEPQPVIRLLTLKGGKERSMMLKDWSSINAIDWAADGKTLWVSASTTTGTNGLLNVDLQGRVHPVWEQTKMYVGWAIPSPDGRYLALWQASGNSNVWMVENF